MRATLAVFIDDERFPVEAFHSKASTCVIVRSVEQAKTTVRRYLKDHDICYVSFDHDLGDRSLTGLDFAKWLVAQDLGHSANPLNRPNCLTEDFYYDVHSANPVGEKNIRGYLDGYLRKKRDGFFL